MPDTYSPATIDRDTLDAILARVGRYVRRHGSEFGETPCPGGDMEEAAAVIVADWQSADWEAVEWTYLQRNGRPLFTPDLSDTGRHLRAALFMAGRARVRGWVEQGPARRAARAETRRRDIDDSTGVGMASRAPDPARAMEAVEQAQRSGIRSTPDRFRRRRLRWVKTRNSRGYTVDVVARHDDRTDIDIRAFTQHNFRRAGDLRCRDMARTSNRVPAGITADQLREAITG